MHHRAALVGCGRVLVTSLGVAFLGSPMAATPPPALPACRPVLAPVRVAMIPWSSVRRSSESAERWSDPASFMVDAEGTVTVLSPGLARLQRFLGGRRTVSVSLPEESWFEDFADSSRHTTLLARAGARVGVFELTAAGSLRTIEQLPTRQVPQPGLITALEQRADGLWLVVEDAYAVSVTAGSNPVRPGVFWDEHGSLRAAVDGNELSIAETPAAGGSPSVVVRATIPGGQPTVQVLARLADGRIAALVAVEHEQTIATRPPAVSAVLLTWTAPASAPCAAALPWDTRGAPPFEPMRRARAVADRVTFWRATRRGIELYSLRP